MSKEQIEVGDVVQLSPDASENRMFAAAMMVVTEVKSWGAQGYVQALGKDGEPGGHTYYRAKAGTFEYVGPAVWVAP